MKCFTAKNPGQPLHIVYVPSHLYHMLFELFKVRFTTVLEKQLCTAFRRAYRSLIFVILFYGQNAMRATVETHETSPALPPIKLRVSLGTEDLTIKVDEDTGFYLCIFINGSTLADTVITYAEIALIN